MPSDSEMRKRAQRSARPERCDDDRSRVVLEAFESLRDRLLGTAFYVIGRRADAHDAVQEAFFKCWRRRDQIDGVRNVEGWVTTVVLNQARDMKRRIKRQQPLEELMIATTDTPYADAERQETLQRVRQAIYRLPEPEREVFLLRQNTEQSFQEVADALDVPIGTAKTRMRSALRRLRKALRSEPGREQEGSR